MPDATLVHHLGLLWAWAAAGSALALAHLALLRRAVRAVTAATSVRHFIGGSAMRLALVAGVLVLGAHAGAMPLIALVLGFQLTRMALLRWQGAFALGAMR